MVWVWVAADSDATRFFRHPADLPAMEEEAAVKSFFMDAKRGTRIARISPATRLPSKGKMALIAEKGATREVPTHMLLAWYEGLLLLDELESTKGLAGRLGATWFDEELQGILDQERKKHRNGQLSSAVYVERRLTTIAVTGATVYDSKDQEWNYRRENLSTEEPPLDKSTEDVVGFQQIQGIMNYLPPWEALSHEKCGFYQDFYQVRWAHPYSEIDYASVENGCAKGATWEPDECLPAHLDVLRMAAKRNWCKARREREQRALEERQRVLVAQATAKRAQGADAEAPASKRPRAESEAKADAKVEAPLLPPRKPTARTKRDGTALNRDMLSLASGHDLQEPSEKELGGIRNGWPKHAKDYPKGFSAATPPGFCLDTCDCMDDQRPQMHWETNKMWLEDAMRTNQAKGGIDAFSAQTHFVMRRGLVSKVRHYFETAVTAKGETNSMTSAQDLAVSLQRSMQNVLKVIPLSACMSKAGVPIPASVFLTDDFDYSPVRMDFKDSTAPEWLHLEATSGKMTASADASISDDLLLKLTLSHAEGAVATASIGVCLNVDRPWLGMTESLIKRFNDTNRCQLESGARAVLNERFAQVYDFEALRPRDIEVGEWLRIMTIILRMLRSAAVANLTHAPPRSGTSHQNLRHAPQQARMGVVPRTPPQ